MGTRHLIAVQIDGEYKVAQYGQWDGHPGGQGSTVLGFLHGADLEAFRAKARAAVFVGEEDMKARWAECGADPGSNFVDMEVSDRFKLRHPQLSRDCGADVLGLLAEADPGLPLGDQIGFAANSLFCEWGYVVDLDKEVLEVFKGFNQAPLHEGERFHALIGSGSNSDYEPIKLAKSYPLSELPTRDKFLEDFREPDED